MTDRPDPRPFYSLMQLTNHEWALPRRVMSVRTDPRPRLRKLTAYCRDFPCPAATATRCTDGKG